MRVTGNSTRPVQKILSIRLRQGGLSFYASDGDGAGTVSMEAYFAPGGSRREQMTAAFDAFAEKSGIDTYDRVRLFADTADTVFVPDAVVGDAVPAEWLARMGVHLSPDMKAVRPEAYGGVCALFPVDTGVASWLADRLGHRAAWYSPLHESMAAFRRTEASGDCCFVVYPTQENVYISRYGTAGELSLAEVYPLHGAADMVYYLSELAAGERNISLYIYGDRPVRYTDTLKRYFGRVAAI